MRYLLPVLIFICSSIIVQAQNWNPFTPGVKRYFTNVHGYLRGMRIDSVAAYGAELHYFPFKTMRGTVGFDNMDTAGSWLGERVVKKSDGSYLFPNVWGDTIKINVEAGVGDNWAFYQGGSGVHYRAEVISADTMTILGNTDSIKRILLTAFENGIQQPDDSFNNTEMILSKAHGFYQVMELYLFPFYEPGTNQVVDDHYFHISAKQLSVAFLGWGYAVPGPYGCLFRLVNFVEPTHNYIWDVGDVLEYTQCWISGGTTTGCSSPTYMLDTIVGKIVTNNGVEYITKGWFAARDTFIGWNSYYTLHPRNDTVSTFEPYLMPVNANLLPEEFDFSGWGFGPFPYWFYFPADSSYCKPGELYYYGWYAPSISLVQTYTFHKNGMGIVFYNDHDGSGPHTSGRELIYYKKNGVECGTFTVPDTSLPVVNTVEQVTSGQQIKIYPNPTQDQLTLETSAPGYSISIFNVVGQLVYTRANCAGRQVLDLGGLGSGMYQLRVDAKDGAVLKEKFSVIR